MIPFNLVSRLQSPRLR